MPREPPAVPDEQPTIQESPMQDTTIDAHPTTGYEPLEGPEEWIEDPAELPPRPRRRLLAPVPLALLGVLLIACGFIGGVLVEKSQSSSSSGSASSGGLASRFAGLRAGGTGGSTGTSSGRGAANGGSGTSAIAGGSTFAGGGGGGGAARSAGATVGQVAYVSGHTLYVTNPEGNTVKVTTSVASTVTKTVKSDVKAIHPGETVIVTGSPGANGSISAESVRVSEAGAGGGLGALLGGGGAGSRGGAGGSSGGGSAAAGGGGEPALFGK
jgi:hypothetical protein